MSHLIELSDKEKVVSLLRALLARCTDQFDTPYMVQMRKELQGLINKQSKATIRECVTEAVRRMTNPVSETKKNSSRSSARATTSDGNGGNQSDEVVLQFPIKQLFMMQDRMFSVRSFAFNPICSITGQPIATGNKPTEFGSSFFDTGLDQSFDDSDLDSTSLRNVFETQDSSKQLKRELRGARKQLQRYVTSVRQGRFRKAKEEVTQIIRLIESHVETTALSTEFYAFQFHLREQNLEATLFYWAAVIFYGKQNNHKTAISGLRRCAAMFNGINKLLIQQDENNQVIVKKHVIPMMRDLLKMARNKRNVDKKFQCLAESFCGHFLEWSEFLVKEYESRVGTLKEAIRRMREVYGEEDVNKVPLYGDLLCHLGCTYCRLSDFDQAIEYHTLSIEAYKKAEGYPTPQARMQQIASGEHNLMFTKRRKFFGTAS